MRYAAFLIFLIAGLSAYPLAAKGNDHSQMPDYEDLTSFRWNHGAESCSSNAGEPIQVAQANATTYVLRQNKCQTFEAPFIYLLIGSEKALVVDSGAIESPDESPIYQTIKDLVAQHESNAVQQRQIVVAHSHSHRDHTRGDAQFNGQASVQVVGTSLDDLASQLGLTNWPQLISSLDLGGRTLSLIPIPGHQNQSIAIYDKQTGWLLSGDTLYPGVIRVSDWAAYRASIQRLTEFTRANPVTLILGAHIEWNARTNQPYKIGSTYQPDESALPLSVTDLEQLNQKLLKTSKKRTLKFKNFMISPLNFVEQMLQKALS